MKLLSMLPFDVRHKVEQAVHFDKDCFQVSLEMKNRCEWYQFLILMITKKNNSILFYICEDCKKLNSHFLYCENSDKARMKHSLKWYSKLYNNLFKCFFSFSQNSIRISLQKAEFMHFLSLQEGNYKVKKLITNTTYGLIL